jgi:electron transport complex protein RnfG
VDEIRIEREPTALRIVATLVVFGAISGTMLVLAFLETQPRILRNQYEAMRAAVFRVLPGTESVTMLVIRDGALVPYEGPEGVLPSEPTTFLGVDAGGRRVGYAIPGEGPGFMDTIKILYGFDPTRRAVIGMEVLDSRETPGLGDKIAFDPKFLANFETLTVDPEIAPVKRGQKTRENEVDCITGATISSEAVVRILNESRKRWDPVLAPAEAARAEMDDGAEDR